MADSSEQEQAAELVRQAEAMRAQGKSIFRAVQQYIAGARQAEADATTPGNNLVTRRSS